MHIDRIEFPHVDFVQDVQDLNNFEDGCAELVTPAKSLPILIAIKFPMFFVNGVAFSNPAAFSGCPSPISRSFASCIVRGLIEFFLGTLYGKIPNGEEFAYHKTTFDEPTMRRILEEAGFHDIGLWDWRETEHASVDDFSQAYYPHMDKEHGMLFNLNIRAMKPA